MNVTGEAVTNRWIKPLEHIPHDVWESDPKKTGAKVAKHCLLRNINVHWRYPLASPQS